MFLEGAWSSRRSALLFAALPLFLPKFSTLSDCPGQHSSCINPDGLLFGPASCRFPFGRVSCSSCSLLPRSTREPGVQRFVHLRRFMRLLLFRGINLLYSCSRETNRSASDPTIGMSRAICLCPELQGDGGHTSRDRFDIRGLEMPSFGRLETVRPQQLAFCCSIFDRRPAYRSLYLRQNRWQQPIGKARCLSAPIFMAQFPDCQCEVC